ncbi:MAG: STY4526/YPO1902 family pathogenicity island replication protein, partial [Gammaproteobacteria bacterium]
MNVDRQSTAGARLSVVADRAKPANGAERRTERIVRHWDSRTKEAELNYAVLAYAARCLTEGDIDALRQVDFEPEDVHVIDELRLSDLHALAAARAHALNVRIDREALHWLVEHIRRRRARDALRLELLRADAPSEMMASLFGMTGRGYTATRE